MELEYQLWAIEAQRHRETHLLQRAQEARRMRPVEHASKDQARREAMNATRTDAYTWSREQNRDNATDVPPLPS